MKPPVLRGKPIVPPAQLSRIRFSPCGQQLAAASHDATIKRWDVTGTDAKELPALGGHNGYVVSLAFHPDKQRLFTCDTWGKLTGWNYLEGKVIWEVPSAHDGWLRAIALSPKDAQLLADHADVLTMLQDRSMSGEPARLVEQISERPSAKVWQDSE